MCSVPYEILPAAAAAAMDAADSSRKTESWASSLLHMWIFLAPLREINVLLLLLRTQQQLQYK